MTVHESTTDNAPFDELRSWLESETDGLLAPLRDYAARLRSAKGRGGGTASRLSAAAVERLMGETETIIAASAATSGAGFIAAPHVVDGAERYMMWLQRRNGDVRRLRLNFDTSDIDAYDYVQMDWYLASETRRQPSLTGPFLDYSGSAALVLTLAFPVVDGQVFLGVVALDLLAQAAEEHMTAQLCRVPASTLVVNRHRTVVASNSVDWMPGERLPCMPSEDRNRFDYVAAIGDWTGWQLASVRPGTVL